MVSSEYINLTNDNIVTLVISKILVKLLNSSRPLSTVHTGFSLKRKVCILSLSSFARRGLTLKIELFLIAFLRWHLAQWVLILSERIFLFSKRHTYHGLKIKVHFVQAGLQNLPVDGNFQVNVKTHGTFS